MIRGFLADDVSETELLAEYPQLDRENVLATIAYDTGMVRKHFVWIKELSRERR